ncbi:hypothetical protein [Chitinophaga ginsengisegetis]|uniref:hypothetical protein n=1 Tax=Chitinophaga ginsengisegetis TaxID=393003 RepID=UPI000DB991EF|nr:hypothetical protein [Chitinophaga ginsengisegetis]MDR6570883.1 hypothetical protein [Chitinophaga ginsengisegetis]MDR6650617.1 hypothetical protein [Chitinophaga ginsengisegetis]MDR6656967.1 hypothetical protein [Chitinophaga ginsengisegetis]
MSRYVSLILFISGMEDEDDRMEEVITFEMPDGASINLVDVNHSPFPDLFPRSIYCGTYRNIDVNNFLTHLREKVSWKYAEFNSLIVQEEGKGGLDFYSLKP